MDRLVTVREAIESLGEPHAARTDGHVLHAAQARAYRGHTPSGLDAPSKTIVAGSAHGVPGGANTLLMYDGSMRHYTVREAARIQTFPDTYTLPSTWSVAFRQLGNAVPCNLARAWGHRIKRALQKEK